MVSSCSILFTDFGTLFVFAVGPLLPLSVIFSDYNGNFNEKMSKINKINRHLICRLLPRVVRGDINFKIQRDPLDFLVPIDL